MQFESQQDLDIARVWAESIAVYSHNWRSVLTKHGQMAMAPPGVRKGDKICLFLDHRVPFVLRPEGDRWSLVGDAHLHGGMHVSFTDHITDFEKDHVLSPREI